MMNFGSLSRLPEAPQSAAANPWKDLQETGPQLLELRTEAGAVYVCPSRWQRIRLQWAFRHFHVLPLQVLSRRDQRLIEKLSQSAVVTPASPVAGTTVIGVVEKVHSKPPAPAARVVTIQPQLAAAQTFRAKPWAPALLSPDFSHRVKEKKMRQIFGTAKTRDVRDVPFRQRGALGALAAACFTVIVASFYGNPLVSSTVPMKNAQTLSMPMHASNNIKPPVAITPPPASPPTLPTTVKPKHPVAPPAPEPTLPHNELASLEDGTDQPTSVINASAAPILALTTVPDTVVEPAPINPSSTPEPLFVSELPQGQFAYPVVSEPNLVGELRLKAVIGADGLVKQVTVLSGNPKLAEVGMRAVRQWHYTPYEVLGSPVEVETQIKMSFFGEDAVSVASVAAGPPSSSRDASVPSPHTQPLSSKPND
jgi:hypothetical protein